MDLILDSDYVNLYKKLEQFFVDTDKIVTDISSGLCIGFELSISASEFRVNKFDKVVSLDVALAYVLFLTKVAKDLLQLIEVTETLGVIDLQ